MKAYLLLSDGTLYEGSSIGAEGEIVAELCFTDVMCGFVEEACDKKVSGKALVYTYPVVAGYGVSKELFDNAKPAAKAVVVREACEKPSNYLCVADFNQYLKNYGVIGIESVDTRSIIHKIRGSKKALKALITTTPVKDINEALKKFN